MMKKILKYCVFVLLFNGCGNDKISTDDMDNFIDKYKLEDFKYFKNYSIIIRQNALTETVYMINESDSNIDSILFFVYVNRITNEVTEIKRGSDKDSKFKENLNDDKIIKMIHEYRKYNFPYLSVDNENNVSINPFYTDMKPFLLHLKVKSDQKKIKKNFTSFRYYRDNWYIRE